MSTRWPSASTTNTALVVGSAPQYPQGVIDPIPELAELAATVGASMHVDACMGGFVLPFMEMNGESVAPWDFRVDGVTTLSADVHKLGYAPKGASVIVARDEGAAPLPDVRVRRLARRLRTRRRRCRAAGPASPWPPRGPCCTISASTAIAGSRKRPSTRTHVPLAGVRATPGLAVLGEPDAHLFAITSPRAAVDVFALGDALHARGWHLDRQRPPDCLHADRERGNAPVVDDFLSDLRAAVAAVAGTSTDDRSTNYATTE